MGHTDGVDDDPTKFAIWTSEGNESEIFLLTASSEEAKNEWVNALKNVLASQNAFAMGKLAIMFCLFYLCCSTSFTSSAGD